MKEKLQTLIKQVISSWKEKNIYASGLLKQKFGKEIPLLIHELEYYDEIARQNILANGEDLVSDFTAFCAHS